MTNPPQNITHKKFLAHYSGSIGVRRLEFDREERNLGTMTDYVKRNLPNYWPAYQVADIFDEDGKHLLRLNALIAVVVR